MNEQVIQCTICGADLDEYAAESESEYCSSCTSPIGSFLEVLNYFRFHFQRGPLETLPEEYHDDLASGIDVNPADYEPEVHRWPDEKDVAAHHAKACRLFPGWRDIVLHWRELRRLSTFDNDALAQLVEYARQKGVTAVLARSLPRVPNVTKTYEEVGIIRRSALLNMIKADLDAREAGAVADEEQSRAVVERLLQPSETVTIVQEVAFRGQAH